MKWAKCSSRLSILTIIFVIGSMIEQHQVQCALEALSSKSFVKGISRTILDRLVKAYGAYRESSDPSEDDTIEKLVELADAVDEIEIDLRDRLDIATDSLLGQLPSVPELKRRIEELTAAVIRVERVYSDFRNYVKSPSRFDSIELEELASAPLSSRSGDMRDNVKTVRELIAPVTMKKSLLLLLAQETQDHRSDLCDTYSSPQQRIFEIYAVGLMTEIRGYVLGGFAYLQKSINEEKNQMPRVRKTQKKFNAIAEEYQLTLGVAMEMATKEFRRCDPSGGQVRGETFFEFEKFMQGFVIQETALTTHHKCYESCSELVSTRQYPGCTGFECGGSWTRCNGTVNWCDTLHKSAEICQYATPQPRRYQYVIDGNGTPFGQTDQDCRENIFRPGSTKYGEFLCDLCHCYCTEDYYKSRSFHFVNLRPAESDIQDNKVVTGVRFRMEERILHIQIQQGTLGPFASISEGTTDWKDLEHIEYDEESSIKNDEFRFDKQLGDGSSGSWQKLEVGKDIHVLERQSRVFYLDHLEVPKDHAITGVRFDRRSSGDLSRPVYLLIRSTKFDYVTGKLKDLDESEWISFEDTDYGKIGKSRDEVNNDQRKNPLRENKSVLDGGPNESVLISNSQWVQDASQTVLPLLDALPVYGKPAIPLDGLGLYYKAPSGFGGYLTFVARGLDRTPYVKM